MKKELVVAGVATAVAVGGGYCAYKAWGRYSQRSLVIEQDPMYAGGSVVSIDSSTDLATVTDDTPPAVTEDELVRLLSKLANTLQAGNSIDRKKECEALAMLQGYTDITSAKVSTRLLVAQYCASVFSMNMMSPAAKALPYDKVMDLRSSLENTYLVSAWEVLNASGKPDSLDLTPEVIGRWHALKLDVACRLHDSEKMENAYDEAAADPGCASQDKLVLLASAALVGRWDEVRRIGELLAPTGELDLLHVTSMKDPSMVDYASLFLLAAQIAGTAADAHLWQGMRKHDWNAFTLKTCRFKLAPNASQAPLRPDVTTESWTTQKPSLDVPLMRTGAIVHMVNPGGVPLPLSGFAGEDDMCLLGYFDVEQAGEQLRFTEFFTFKRDKARSNFWVGKELSTMLSVVGPRAGEKITEVVIDVELELVMDRKSPWKAL